MNIIYNCDSIFDPSHSGNERVDKYIPHAVLFDSPKNMEMEKENSNIHLAFDHKNGMDQSIIVLNPFPNTAIHINTLPLYKVIT